MFYDKKFFDLYKNKEIFIESKSEKSVNNSKKSSNES